MVKGAKKHASGGQGINPLDPTCVTVTDRWSVTVTIKTCLASPSYKNWQKVGPGRATGGKLSRHGLLWLKWV